MEEIEKFTGDEIRKASKIVCSRKYRGFQGPKYFLHSVDPAFMNLLKSEDVADIPESVINPRVQNYLKKSKELEIKSSAIAEWQDLPKYEFFQFVIMHSTMYIPLERVSQDQIKEISQRVKNGQMNLEQGLNALQVSKDAYQDFFNSRVDDFEIEVD